MEKVVIKLTGLVFEGEYSKQLMDIKDVLIKYSKKYRMFVVTGGGPRARKLIDYGRILKLNKGHLDYLGIEISKIHAKILSYLLGDLANKVIPTSVEEALDLDKPIIVMGGTQPGQSTDAVAAILAEYVNAQKLVIGTRVDGIYNKDPRKYPNAKLLKEISINELKRILKSKEIPGEYRLIDSLALNIIERSRIPTVFINILNYGNLKSAFENKNAGTRINFR